MGIVYITTNKINGKKYIGVDTKNRKYYLGSGKSMKLSIKKYGSENFIKEIIESSEDNKYLFEREKYWIEFYDAVNSPLFYNISIGGKGGNMLNNEDSIMRHKIGSKKSIDKNKLLRSGKTYEQIYGDKAEEEKLKRKLAGLGKKYDKERIEKSALSRKGLIPWNKGLTRETDNRVDKNITNRKSYQNIKLYELITPLNERIIFDGKLELKNYIKSINKEYKRGNKINIDNLIINKELLGFKLNIINKKQLNNKL